MEPVDLARVLDLLDARDMPVWTDLDVCPRTCPSAYQPSEMLSCTYERWFARPTTLRNVALLYELPLSAACLLTFLQFRMGCHGLPNDVGGRRRIPRMQRSCPRCAMHGIANERHLVFECPALQPVRDKFPILYGAGVITMKDFMWQADNLQVAKFVQACFAVLDDSVGSVRSSNQP